MSDIMEKAIVLGDHLYSQYIESGGGCENLLMEWAKERFYGLLVKDHVKVFDDLWQMLVDKGHRSYNTSSSHGDMDYSVWAERTGKDDDLKVIVSTCHCAMRDDNTYVYTRSGFKYEGDRLMESCSEFRCCTVWPRQKKTRYSKAHTFGDQRDIEKPSLNTLRKYGFNYGYRDGRDTGHAFLLRNSHNGPRVEHAHWNEPEIPRALDNLKWLLCDLRGDHE